MVGKRNTQTEINIGECVKSHLLPYRIVIWGLNISYKAL